MQTDYAEIVTSKPVQRFLLKFYLSDVAIESLILISPFMGTLEGTRITLDSLCKKALEKQIPLYVITCPPESEFTQKAVDTLKSYDNVEIRFNNSLHAKLYVCICKDESQSFGLLGSANLTRSSIENMIEIAMLIYGRGNGREILRELARWGSERLRTMSTTKIVKKIKYIRRDNYGI